MTNTEVLFGQMLGLEAPWRVEALRFDPDRRRVDIKVGFPAGSKFPCPAEDCGAECSVHDADERTWRHLNLFQHEAYLTAGQPRTACPAHGVLTVTPPWTRRNSHFTLLFDAFVLELACCSTRSSWNSRAPAWS